ncbi:MAG TPA: hydrogenase maturation nickel metallochaperone HypA [Chloroflexia bacterium]|nr:hydrogenase maturation nickel metallochaperone HypA [Chloroflexia bacterium]
MHEHSVTEEMLSVALAAAEQAGAPHITGIHLVIGDLSGITEDSVRFYFDMLSPGTPAEGAHLDFRREEAVATCLDCGERFVGSDPGVPLARPCPACVGARIGIEGGDRFYLESIDTGK